ncbi:GNAT family N-acetyltransferase [Fictibacillus sp. NPDC058756]
MQDGNVIGYKMGYESDKRKFYSWLGGVDSQHRGQGIAAKLMNSSMSI